MVFEYIIINSKGAEIGAFNSDDVKYEKGILNVLFKLGIWYKSEDNYLSATPQELKSTSFNDLEIFFNGEFYKIKSK
jgi:hypothetical protein